jgi:hypothetical protein
LLNERNNKLLTSDRLEHKFKKGDFVRLNLASGVFTNEMKKSKKSGIGWNKISVHWSPEVYEVVRVVPTTQKEKAHYTVANSAGLIVRKKFYANDIQIIRNLPETIPTTLYPADYVRALKINRM